MVIPAERKLVVKPGVVIKSSYEMAWLINGTLEAIGTDDKPIYFTARNDDTVGGDSYADDMTGDSLPRPGDWENLVFGAGSSGSKLEHVEVRYAGNSYGYNQNPVYNQPAIKITGGSAAVFQDVDIVNSRGIGVRIEDSAPTLRDVHVEQGGDWPFYINLAANPIWSGITSTGSAKHGIVVDRGTLSQDLVWDITTLPYVMTGGGRFDNGINMVIPADRKLTVKPGVVIKSANEMVWVINGILDAVGTPSQPIIFTSTDDDVAGGDSFGDGQQTTPRPGDWEGLIFGPTASNSRLENLTIRYAGNAYGPTDNPASNRPALLAQTNLSVLGLILESNRGPGIQVEAGVEFTLSQSLLSNNGGAGIQVAAGGGAFVSGSAIVGTAAGITVSGVPSATIVAQGNWWGHANGPHHPTGIDPLNDNPAGVAVSDHVDFTGYLTAPPPIRGMPPRSATSGCSLIPRFPRVRSVPVMSSFPDPLRYRWLRWWRFLRPFSKFGWPRKSCWPGSIACGLGPPS